MVWTTSREGGNLGIFLQLFSQPLGSKIEAEIVIVEALKEDFLWEIWLFLINHCDNFFKFGFGRF